MIPLLIEVHYLPCIEYFAYLYHTNSIYIEAQENYVKQSYRNRCRIKGANQVDDLSVPTVNMHAKVLVRDVKIDYTRNWANQHRRAIRSAYGNAPFYEYYASYFDEVWERKHKFLFDLDMDMLEKCLQLTGISKQIGLTERYEKEKETSLIDRRGKISPKFDSENYDKVASAKYYQNFGSTFEPNLSIVDLLFNEGKNTLEILKLCKIV